MDRVDKTPFHLSRMELSSQPQISLKYGDVVCEAAFADGSGARALILESGPTLSVTLTAPRSGGTLILV